MMVLIGAKSVQSYQTSAANNRILDDLLVEVTTGLQMFLLVTFGRKLNLTSLTFLTTGISLLRDHQTFASFVDEHEVFVIDEE